MENLIVSIILIVILGTAIGYIIKEKKKGTRCIGCPAAGNCKNAGQCKCHQLSNDNDCI